jgi:hypothetical protein
MHLGPNWRKAKGREEYSNISGQVIFPRRDWAGFFMFQADEIEQMRIWSCHFGSEMLFKIMD